MYRRYQNRATRSELICFMGAEPTREGPADARGLLRALDNERPEPLGEFLFGEAVFDKGDYFIGPIPRIVDRHVELVLDQKLNHRDEAGSFVALLEGVGLHNTRHQPDRESDHVFFAINESVLGTS